ncbi:MAG TPA: hypothetical protein VGI39_33770 [Polyangiaceae bacterium]|jgi:hypothetical protein
MPTIPHEAPILLFRENPELVAELLREVAGVAVPPHDGLRVEDSNFAQIAPSEHRADLVLTLVAGGKPVMGIVVEVQLDVAARKRFVWPLYLGALHARLSCVACLVVMTADAEVARWAAKPITTFQPGSPFVPIVVGPDRIPVVTSYEEAQRVPELAVLSALAHGTEARAVEIGRAALGAAGRLDEERRTLYTDLILYAVSREARAVLETEMNLTDYEFKSDFFKEKIAQKSAEASAEARAKALVEGRAEGRAQGRAEGLRTAILTTLSTRSVPLTDAGRARLASCADVEALTRWLQHAVTASSETELFANEP